MRMLLRVGCRNPVMSPQCGINVVSQYTPKWQSYMIDLLLIEHKLRKYIPKAQAAEKHSVFMLFSNRTDFRTGRSMETKKIGLGIFVDINYLCFL